MFEALLVIGAKALYSLGLQANPSLIYWSLSLADALESGDSALSQASESLAVDEGIDAKSAVSGSTAPIEFRERLITALINSAVSHVSALAAIVRRIYVPIGLTSVDER